VNEPRSEVRSGASGGECQRTHHCQRSTCVVMRHPSNPSRPPAAAIAQDENAICPAGQLVMHGQC
jgi:hypothetical protein